MKPAISTLLAIILFAFSANAQDNAPAWDYLNVKQINPNINIQLGKQHENFMDGQAYVAAINNISTNKVNVTGSVVAYLTCGNQVSSAFNVTLNPGESAGGGSPALLNMDDLGGHAMNTDCLGEKKYPDPVNRPTYYYLDRIRTVGITNLRVTIVIDNSSYTSTQSSNTNSSSQATSTNYNNQSQNSNANTGKSTQVQQRRSTLVTPKIYNGTSSTAETNAQIADGITNIIGIIANHNNVNRTNQNTASTETTTQNDNYTPPPRTNYTPAVTNSFPLVNAKAPAIQFTQANGTVFKLSDYAGKNVLLVFWASYNDASIEQSNIIKANYSFLNSKGIVIIGLAQEYSSYQWQTAVKDNQLPGLQISELNGPGNDTYQNYQLTQLPTLFFINAAGEIAAESYSFDGIKSSIH
jgi:peroxiredoxin